MSTATDGRVRLSLDAMGGDHGPSVVLGGAALALKRFPDLVFQVYGDSAAIAAELAKLPALRPHVTVFHTEVAIAMDEKPSQALRRGRFKSSMWQAIDAVKKGEVQAAVSAGNTGALMAMSRFRLGMMQGIDRPALACLWPTMRGQSIVLDVGASIGAQAENLVDMALMGAAMARILFHMERPSVGLLNIGVEEVKGAEQVREAGRILREADLPGLVYHGFIEGDDIGRGTTDIVVTEGFAGNIALKTAEGTARQVVDYLKAAILRSWRARLGALLARPAFAALKARLDPRAGNGAVFLGLDGIVVKSHGGTDAVGYASAIEVATDMVRHELLARIGKAFIERGAWVLPGASVSMVEAMDASSRESASADTEET